MRLKHSCKKLFCTANGRRCNQRDARRLLVVIWHVVVATFMFGTILTLFFVLFCFESFARLPWCPRISGVGTSVISPVIDLLFCTFDFVRFESD